MKTRISVLVMLFAIIAISGFAQAKSRKQIKEEAKIEKQKQTEALVNSKTFVFNARMALPTGYKSVNLTTGGYNVKFSPELIDSYLPFYGKAYSGVGYGGDAGMKFSGKPEAFTVAKSKKNYTVNATVKGEKDTYRISLSVGFEGSATLSITSNNRSFISYNGEIIAPENPVNK